MRPVSLQVALLWPPHQSQLAPWAPWVLRELWTSGPCGDLLGALARWLCPSPWLLEVLLELTQDRKFPSFPAGPEQTGQAEGWGGGWQGRGPCGVQTLPGSHHAALGSAAHSGPGLCLGPQLYQALRGLSSKWGGGPSASSGLHLGSAQGLHGRGSRTLGLWPSQQDPDHRVGVLYPRPPRPGLDLSPSPRGTPPAIIVGAPLLPRWLRPGPAPAVTSWPHTA